MLHSLSTTPIAWRTSNAGVHIFTVACDLSLDLALFSGLSGALRYWEGKRAGRALPGRDDIDPVEMGDFLPRVMLADVERDPLRFRYRVCGTGICRIHQGDPTHLAADELQPGSFGQLIHGQYAEVMESRQPALHLTLSDKPERFRSSAQLILPLARDHENVDMIMTVDSSTQDSADMIATLIRLQRRAGTEKGRYYFNPVKRAT